MEINKMKRITCGTLALTLLLSACSSTAASPTPVPTAEPALEPTPAPGETPSSDAFQAMVVGDWSTLDWRHETYPDADQFIREWGFDPDEPFYGYQDSEGNLQLVLYYDSETDAGCGIRYVRLESGEVEPKGFAFETTLSADSAESKFKASHWTRWEADYTRLPIWNDPGLEDYLENKSTDEAGRVTKFETFAIFEDYPEEEVWVYSVKYAYDENGTLRYRDFGKNPQLFGTNDSSWGSYLDEQGRVSHERGYLTHGSQEYYYIYDGDSGAPAYCLYLDEDCGIWGPSFFRY